MSQKKNTLILLQDGNGTDYTILNNMVSNPIKAQIEKTKDPRTGHHQSCVS